MMGYEVSKDILLSLWWMGFGKDCGMSIKMAGSGRGSPSPPVCLASPSPIMAQLFSPLGPETSHVDFLKDMDMH